MRPEDGSTRRLIIRIVVVLPQPEGPTSTASWPSGTSRVNSCTATVPSAYSLRTESRRIIDPSPFALAGLPFCSVPLGFTDAPSRQLHIPQARKSLAVLALRHVEQQRHPDRHATACHHHPRGGRPRFHPRHPVGCPGETAPVVADDDDQPVYGDLRHPVAGLRRCAGEDLQPVPMDHPDPVGVVLVGDLGAQHFDRTRRDARRSGRCGPRYGFQQPADLS